MEEKADKRVLYVVTSVLSCCSRFLINIPDEDKDDAMRLCAHIELAHWFYLDFLRQDQPTLPACSLKEFMATSTSRDTFIATLIVVPDTESEY